MGRFADVPEAPKVRACARVVVVVVVIVIVIVSFARRAWAWWRCGARGGRGCEGGGVGPCDYATSVGTRVCE